MLGIAKPASANHERPGAWPEAHENSNDVANIYYQNISVDGALLDAVLNGVSKVNYHGKVNGTINAGAYPLYTKVHEVSGISANGYWNCSVPLPFGIPGCLEGRIRFNTATESSFSKNRIKALGCHEFAHSVGAYEWNSNHTTAGYGCTRPSADEFLSLGYHATKHDDFDAIQAAEDG
jgi:hypothetical protein